MENNKCIHCEEPGEQLNEIKCCKPCTIQLMELGGKFREVPPTQTEIDSFLEKAMYIK